LTLGYAYPGFECYKSVEKNRVDIDELRFWCKYWIIVALFTVLERFPDIFIGWLPLYGEMKLVFFVYLWYPKTKGTAYIYETVLRPIVSRHENDIDRKIMEWKARAWDYIIFYWQYCAKYGSTAFIQVLQQVASQSMRFSANNNAQTSKSIKNDAQGQNGPQAPSSQSQSQSQNQSFMKHSSSLSKSKKWPPSPPPSPSKTPKFRSVVVRQNSFLDEEGDGWGPEPVSIDGEAHDSHSVNSRISRARARLRRLDSQDSPRTPGTPPRGQLLKKQITYIVLFFNYAKEARDCVEYSAYGLGESGNYVVAYEVETRGEGVVVAGGGESVVEAAEEVRAGWAAGGSGHGLEVGPCGLLHKAVADGDLVVLVVACDGGVDGGRKRKHVFEGSIRWGFDGEWVVEKRFCWSGGGGGLGHGWRTLQRESHEWSHNKPEARL
ncbi:HVA22-like protein j, partial [Mucuna pruriens]